MGLTLGLYQSLFHQTQEEQLGPIITYRPTHLVQDRPRLKSCPKSWEIRNQWKFFWSKNIWHFLSCDNYV